MPGDVGTYTPEDGFRKMFNIWDDAESIRVSASALMESSYEPPPNGMIHHPGKMDVGDIISEGLSSKPAMCTINRVK